MTALAGNLTKSTVTTYIPGNPGYPGYAGSPYRAAYCATTQSQSCRLVANPAISYRWETWYESSPPPGRYVSGNILYYNGVRYDLTGLSGFPLVVSSCATAYSTTCYPAVAAVPGYAGVAATPAQVIVSLNPGWNTHSRTKAPLLVDHYFKFTASPANVAAFIGVDTVARDAQLPTDFPYGLLLDTSGVYVYEYGSIVHTFSGAYTSLNEFFIEYRADKSITYRMDTQQYVSALSFNALSDVYVYGDLYTGRDTILSAEFGAIPSAVISTATVSGTSVQNVAAPKVGSVQYSKAYLSGSGTLMPSALAAGGTQYGKVRFTGSGLLSPGAAVVPQTILQSMTLSGSGTIIAGGVVKTASGAIVQPHYTAAMLTGYGQISAVSTALEGTGFMPHMTSIGSEDPDFVLGYANIPALTITASAQSLYIPPVPTSGYGLLPLMAATGLVGELEYWDVTSTLPHMVSLGGDYDYAVGVGYFPVGIAYGQEGNRLDMYMVSGAISYDTHIQQVELVFVMLSDGTLASVYADSMVKVQEYISQLIAGSVNTMLGTYGNTLMSQLRVMSLQTAAIIGQAALDNVGRVWVVNMDSAASSQYDNYGFNSFFVRGGESYGVADDGVYRLTGATDLLEPIIAEVNLGSTRLNTTVDKRLPAVYINAASDGKLILKVEVDGSEPYHYEARSSSTTLDNHRVDTGRGLKSNNWMFTLMNQNGDDFELANLEFVPLQGTRRI